MELLLAALRPAAAATGFPAELIPLAILRSLSGSGSLALTTDQIKTHGPDSLMARMAATLYGSSETTFYVLAVYSARSASSARGTRCLRHSSATWWLRSPRWLSMWLFRSRVNSRHRRIPISKRESGGEKSEKKLDVGFWELLRALDFEIRWKSEVSSLRNAL